MWTLVYSGVEKALADWGICADAAAGRVSKQHDALTLRTVEAFDAAAAQFAWGAKIVIYKDRTAVGSGGSIYFQGYIGDLVRSAQGGNENIGYQVYGTWWLFERTKFKQTRQTFAGYSSPGVPTFSTIFLTEIYLGEAPDGSYLHIDEQITEVVNWVNECWNPTKKGATSGRDNSQDVVQIGTIDPVVNFPKTRVNDIFCAEAIVQVLRWAPDCIIWFDDTTSPPALNIRAAANLTEVTLVLTSEQEKQITVSPRVERQLNGVMIKYKRTDVTDGQAWPQVFVDAYPGPGGVTIGGVHYDQASEYDPEVATYTVELSGAQQTHVTVDVKVMALAGAVSGVAATRKAWWLAVDRTLSDPLIDAATIAVKVATVKDDSGTDIDLGDYPNILTQGQIANWMGVDFVQGTIEADVSYTIYADTAHLARPTTVIRKVHLTKNCTDAVTRTYRAVKYNDPGEAVPVGVAQAVFTSMQPLRHSGNIELVGAQLRAGVAMGTKLKLIGPNNTYTELLTQGIEAVPFKGSLSVAFGPASRLDAPGLIELARATRWRVIYNMPSGRATGESSGQADVGLGDGTDKHDTQHSVSAYSQHAISFDNGDGTSSVVNHDAQNATMAVEEINNADGTRNTAAGSIVLAREDCLGGDGVRHQVKLREVEVCSGLYAIIGMSELYPVPPP